MGVSWHTQARTHKHTQARTQEADKAFYHGAAGSGERFRAGMRHTVIWDVQFGKIRVNIQNFKQLCVTQFRECRFLFQNGPDSPQNHPKRPQFFSYILYVINIIYNSIGSSLKGR